MQPGETQEFDGTAFCIQLQDREVKYFEYFYTNLNNLICAKRGYW